MCGRPRVPLTFLRYDPQRDAEARVLDELDDVGVRHADDGLAVHRQDPVAHLQLAAAVGRAALDDAADLVGHGCREEKHDAREAWATPHATREWVSGSRDSPLAPAASGLLSELMITKPKPSLSFRLMTTSLGSALGADVLSGAAAALPAGAWAPPMLLA